MARHSVQRQSNHISYFIQIIMQYEDGGLPRPRITGEQKQGVVLGKWSDGRDLRAQQLE